MDANTTAFYGLAGNSHGLLSGGGVSSVRRRLKLSSLLNSEIFVEDGGLSVQAGPTGSAVFRGATPDTWQTPKARHRAQESPFQVAIGLEPEPGRAPATLRSMILSETSISWQATYMPFEREFSSPVDWIHFSSRDLPTRDALKLIEPSRIADRDNPELLKLGPNATVRSRIRANVNDDLMTSFDTGSAVAFDSLHSHVVRARILRGLVEEDMRFITLPVVVPRIERLSWADIASLRKHQYFSSLQQTIHEITTEVFVGRERPHKLEDVIHEVFSLRLARAAPREPSITGMMRSATLAMAVATIGPAMVVSLFGPIPLAAEIPGLWLGAAALLQAKRTWRDEVGWVTAWMAAHDATKPSAC